VIVVRADSKFYTADVAATAARYGAHVSLTTGSNPSIDAAISRIGEHAWTPIHYPNAFVDTDTGELISDAELAQIPYTAFTSRPKRQHVPGRLIVRRVKRLNQKTTPGQDGLFDVWRHHAVFVTSPFPMLQAESFHRDHAIIEQVIADAAASALAHLPWRIIQRQRRLGRALGDRTQPHPRRGRARRQLPRPRHHRDHPRPPDHRARPAGPLRPPDHPAPARTLALATRLAGPARQDPPGTSPQSSGLIPIHRPPKGSTGDTSWNTPAARPAGHPRPRTDNIVKDQQPVEK
jgi:hypothetical protein